MLTERKKSEPDKRFLREQDVYSCIAQSFEDFKEELNSQHSWNIPLDETDGMSIKYVGENMLVVNYHKIKVGRQEDVILDEDVSKKKIDEIAKEVKKRFKKYSKKTLDLKKVKENRSVEKYSRVYAENVPLFGGGYGYGQNIGRFYIINSRFYEFTTS